MAIVWSLYLSLGVILIFVDGAFATSLVLTNLSLAAPRKDVTGPPANGWAWTPPTSGSQFVSTPSNMAAPSATDRGTSGLSPPKAPQLQTTSDAITSSKASHTSSSHLDWPSPTNPISNPYSPTFNSDKLDPVKKHIKTKMKSSSQALPPIMKATTFSVLFSATLPVTEPSLLTQPIADSNSTIPSALDVAANTESISKCEHAALTIPPSTGENSTASLSAASNVKNVESTARTSTRMKVSMTTSSTTDYQNGNSLKVTKDKQTLNKEHSQFSGITLKVSHVLIPKQKRSRYNIQNMRIELPKTDILSRSPPSVPKTSKNSNCTRFPAQVVTAADTESKEKVNLTEEHYDCEFSSQIQNIQKKDPIGSIHTYFGGYIFHYAPPKTSTNGSSVENQSSVEATKTSLATTVDENGDYDSSYADYPEPSNTNNSARIDDGVFPDPVIVAEKKAAQMKPEKFSAAFPDSSTVLDGDLHDHDLIDSVMYIYFGGASHGHRGAGRQIIIVGAVIALVAQFLTLASSVRRIKTHKGEEPTVILLNVETALTLTNLLFILGVQSTGNHTLCKITAVSLYYLHLVTLLWFLLSSLFSVQIACQIKPCCTFFTFCLCGWLVPFVFTLLSYSLNERSFETSLYCWVSPLKGILFSFILPVILLCIVCIVLTVYGLKRASAAAEDANDTYNQRKLLRISAVALPLFSVIWFTSMVALENSASLLFSLIFLISDTVLNWLLFACWLPSEASQWKDMDEDYYDDEEDYDDEPVLVKRRFDDQPLLSELYEYGAQGQLYNLKVEPISIISTQ